MATAVKKTVALPPELARLAKQMARTEGRTVSVVIQDALCLVRARDLERRFREIQSYWSRKIEEKRILSEEDHEEFQFQETDPAVQTRARRPIFGRLTLAF